MVFHRPNYHALLPGPLIQLEGFLVSSFLAELAREVQYDPSGGDKVVYVVHLLPPFYFGRYDQLLASCPRVTSITLTGDLAKQ